MDDVFVGTILCSRNDAPKRVSDSAADAAVSVVSE
jgi:hypothetical protein